MQIIITAIGLTIANYLCAYWGMSDFQKAFDRSYFQGIALLCLYINIKFTGTSKRKDDGIYCEGQEY